MRRWYMTATHVRRIPGVARELPFGTAHVRMVGGAFTACGEASYHWPIFWDLPLGQAESMCRECARIAREYSEAVRAFDRDGRPSAAGGWPR